MNNDVFETMPVPKAYFTSAVTVSTISAIASTVSGRLNPR